MSNFKEDHEAFKMKPSISFIIPALNEEQNLATVVKEVLGALDDLFSAYEILIFDDGSNDATGEVADRLAEENENIRVIHNGANRGFGYNYREGVRLSKYDYIIMVPGDNEVPGSSIKAILSRLGSADIIIPYMINKEVRSLFRRIISRTTITFVNLLFGLNIRYYNGPVLHKSEIIKSIPLTTDSFAYQIEALVRLLKSGYSYTEVGFNIQIRVYGKTKTFRLKNVINVITTLFRLCREINFNR